MSILMFPETQNEVCRNKEFSGVVYFFSSVLSIFVQLEISDNAIG